MKTIRCAFVILILLFGATSSFAQDVARIEEIVQSYVRTRAFAGAVLVARGSDVVLSKGYGAANLEWDIPNTPATKFRLGSVTKQFTAASILLLEERGKLMLDDPIGKHIPDAPAGWGRITIFHLLTHTSGIPNFTSLPDYRSLKVQDTPVALGVNVLTANGRKVVQHGGGIDGFNTYLAYYPDSKTTVVQCNRRRAITAQRIEPAGGCAEEVTARGVKADVRCASRLDHPAILS